MNPWRHHSWMYSKWF